MSKPELDFHNLSKRICINNNNHACHHCLDYSKRLKIHTLNWAFSQSSAGTLQTCNELILREDQSSSLLDQRNNVKKKRDKPTGSKTSYNGDLNQIAIDKCGWLAFLPFVGRPFSLRRARSFSTVKDWKSFSPERLLDPSVQKNKQLLYKVMRP